MHPGQQKGRPSRIDPDLHSWWRGEDLNLRPSGYEPDELPDCSTPRRCPQYYHDALGGRPEPAPLRGIDDRRRAVIAASTVCHAPQGFSDSWSSSWSWSWSSAMSPTY